MDPAAAPLAGSTAEAEEKAAAGSPGPAAGTARALEAAPTATQAAAGLELLAQESNAPLPSRQGHTLAASALAQVEADPVQTGHELAEAEGPT